MSARRKPGRNRRANTALLVVSAVGIVSAVFALACAALSLPTRYWPLGLVVGVAALFLLAGHVHDWRREITIRRLLLAFDTDTVGEPCRAALLAQAEEEH